MVVCTVGSERNLNECVRMLKIVFMCWWRVIVTVQLCNRYIGGGWKL